MWTHIPFAIITISPTYSCFPIYSICPTSFPIHTTTLSTCSIDYTSFTPLSCQPNPIISTYPLSPSLLSTVVPVDSTKSRSKLAQASTFSKPSTNIQLASTQENISNIYKPPCKFYMQEKCENGRRGTNCSFPHPNMCFRFIRQGNKGCNKDAPCQDAHPKLCRASLTSKRCDRRNCYYYHIAGTLRPLTENELVRPPPHLKAC